MVKKRQDAASHLLPRVPVKLTKAKVDGLKLPQGKSETIVFDEGLHGFGLRIRAGGKRTWIAQYRLGAKQRRMTIGTVETIAPMRRDGGRRARFRRSIWDRSASRKGRGARAGVGDAPRRY